MPSEVIEQTEPKETVSHRIAVSLIRAIEYRAFLDRTNKSDALATLITAGIEKLAQVTPDEAPERRTA